MQQMVNILLFDGYSGDLCLVLVHSVLPTSTEVTVCDVLKFELCVFFRVHTVIWNSVDRLAERRSISSASGYFDETDFAFSQWEAE